MPHPKNGKAEERRQPALTLCASGIMSFRYIPQGGKVIQQDSHPLVKTATAPKQKEALPVSQPPLGHTQALAQVLLENNSR